MIPVLFEDAHVLAVDKPPGLAVHRSHLVGSDDDYLIDRLRRQVDGPLLLVNRLDRATSGIVLVARSVEIAATLGRAFMARDVAKRYLAICRGWPDESGAIDHPLSGAALRGPTREARTRFRRLATTTVPIAIGKYPEQRYALVEVEPETGRYRQIRRHFHHVHHPLIGDTTHGRGEHNRLFKQYFGSHRLLLHAWRLAFAHPVGGAPVSVEAPLDPTFEGLLDRFCWRDALGAVPPPMVAAGADRGASIDAPQPT